MKIQLAADKTSEQIICVNVFNGKAHDLTIFKQTLCRSLRIDSSANLPINSFINPSIQILADSGYRGIQKVHANTLYPLKHKEDIKKLSEEQVKEQKAKNREISSRRMKIEHIIGRIKRFNIISERYRSRRKRFGLRLNLICGIVNYENLRRLGVS